MALDDDVADAVADVLTENGAAYTYTRGASSATVTMRISTPSNETILIEGLAVGVKYKDFLIGTSGLPYGVPIVGDHITTGSTVYQVQPRGGEQTFRQVNPSMTRVFTVQIS